MTLAFEDQDENRLQIRPPLHGSGQIFERTKTWTDPPRLSKSPLIVFPCCGFIARSVAGATSISLGIRTRSTYSKSKIRLSFTRTCGTMRVFERQIVLQS